MSDDWKDEFLLRLKKSSLYNALKDKSSDKDSEVIALVDAGVIYSYNRTKTIIRHMGEFTLHDGEHLFRVLTLMELLLGEENIRDLSVPELMLLILCAFFHDIGMAVDEREVIAFKKIWDTNPVFSDSHEKAFHDGFKRFCSVRVEQQEFIDNLIFQGKVTQADTIKNYLVSEFIRQTHADRARQIIEKDWLNKIVYRDADLTAEMAQLCFSHNDDALSLLEMDKNYPCGVKTVACLPLIGVILRLSDILDFDAKRTPVILFSHLYVRNPISVQEWNKHRAIDAWEIGQELIQFSATCNHPAIEAAIHDFCDLIDRELSVCHNIVSELNHFNKNRGRNINVKFPFHVNREKIRTKRNVYNKPLYIYRETKFELSKRQVIDLLMGTKLYGSPEVALRELIQNSIDACLLRQAQEKKWGNPYNPEISVKHYIEGEDEILEVTDNGTGMDEYIIDNYYSKVGSSFYKSTDFFTLKAETNAEFTPNSRFGIGILSCFMVADILIVDTKRAYPHHKSSEPLNITVEGQESIFWIKPGNRELPGTTTKLILRKARNPWDKMSEDEFIKSVETVIPNPRFKINIETMSHQKTRDENSFEEFRAISLKDYSWSNNENIKTFEINFKEREMGIVGSAIVGILESRKMPRDSVDLTSRNVTIEGEKYSLKRNLSLQENKIIQKSTSITINDEGEITEEDSTQYLANSKSRLSLHGIEVPSSLFPESWNMKNNQVKLSCPFPLLVVVDISGKADLDLNSPRTQIIMSEKWMKFEEELLFQVCNGLAKSVSKTYWNQLKNILISKSENDQFLRAMNRIDK